MITFALSRVRRVGVSVVRVGVGVPVPCGIVSEMLVRPIVENAADFSWNQNRISAAVYIDESYKNTGWSTY